jgi:hypothetical protein
VEDVRRIRRCLNEGRTVFVYYNNDARAICDAQRLKEALSIAG